MPWMTLSFVTFPSGDPMPAMPSLNVFVQPDTTASGGAPPTVPGGSAPPEYSFGYWVVNGQVFQTEGFSIPAPANDFSATGWYFGDGGQVEPVLTTYAFEIDQDLVLASQTPIGSVTPAGIWSGGETTTVPTNESAGPITVVAAPLVDGRVFRFWMALNGATAAGATLTVPAGADAQAIAFYGPDPCADLRQQLDDIGPGDFPNQHAFVAARAKLLQELGLCERRYHEIA